VDTVLAWLEANWFPFLQTVGIVGGLVFTAVSIRQSTRARRASDLLALTEQHRELWNEVYSRPGLERIFAAEVDLVGKPITVTEERFLNEVIIHFQMGWQLASAGSLLTLKAMKADVRSFFQLPIPRSVWEQSKHTRDRKFVDFVDACVRKKKASV
jgi:uncharacterized protein DUF6082